MRSDDFMNAEDVARYLHLGKNTVYQLAKTGKLASYHVGRKLKFTLEDVEAYVASTHHALGDAALPQVATEAVSGAGDNLSEAASFGNLAGVPFVIAGGDTAADMIAGEMNSSGMPAARKVCGSYTALVNLYAGDADAAVVHLYDQASNSCNVPYVRNLAPGASVINISSSRDRMSQPQSESYTAAKGGIAALTHALAASLAGKVRVNSISPGWIDTEYRVYHGPDAIQQPAGRVGNPMDIANMILFLASSKAGFITGENICIDGGQTKLMVYHGDHGWTLNA